MRGKQLLGSTLVAVAISLVAGQAAQATYYTYASRSAPMIAKEGSTVVAKGYGTHGVDYPKNDIGGTVWALDPRPGGSPAQGLVKYHYQSCTGPDCGWGSTISATGKNNYTSSWVSTQVIDDLKVPAHYAQTKGCIQQNDTWPAPDDYNCSSWYNNNW